MDKATLRKTWKELAATEPALSADLHVQYCLMRALLANTNEKAKLAVNMIYHSFTPITNAKKLANGNQPYQAVRSAITWVAVFGSKSPLYQLLDDEAETEYLQILMHVVKAGFSLENMRKKDKTLLYLYVRNDLSPEQITIQTAHLTFEAGYVLHSLGFVGHPNLVVFGLTSAHGMAAKYATFSRHRILCSFHDAHLDNAMTGFVLKPLLASVGRRMKYFVDDQLMTMVNPERSMHVREAIEATTEYLTENESPES